MDYKKQETEKLQWHPALYAGLQIELREDSDNLIFENEHQLGTKPKQIDALIIKKQRLLLFLKHGAGRGRRWRHPGRAFLVWPPPREPRAGSGGGAEAWI